MGEKIVRRMLEDLQRKSSDWMGFEDGVGQIDDCEPRCGNSRESEKPISLPASYLYIERGVAIMKLSIIRSTTMQ
jgi:hypothetical protein